jgi:hypothetical protein
VGGIKIINPKIGKAGTKDGNSGRQFSNAEIRGVTFAMHNQNVANKRRHLISLDKGERAFYLDSF